MKSSISIEVAAPPELVFRLARDVERWPRLLPHYISARRHGPPDGEGRLLVSFVARRSFLRVLGLGLPVTWRSLTWSDPGACRLRFLHRGGATNGMEVTWRIEPGRGGGATVTIDHDFRPRMPGWAFVIDRLFTRPIAGRTLATFKALAEALAGEVNIDAGESGVPPPTNLLA